MRIAIFGTGGAGGYFGAQLARAGEDVTFIARGAHLEAIRTRGLRVETPGGEIVIHPAPATDDPRQVGVVDLVILGVKTWQVTEAARAVKPMIGPGDPCGTAAERRRGGFATRGSIRRGACFGRVVRDHEPGCRAGPYSKYRGRAFHQIRGVGQPGKRADRAAAAGL